MRTPFEMQWWSDLYRNHWGKLWLAQVVVLLAIGFGLAWTIGGTSTDSGQPGVANAQAEPVETAKVWTCSMHPQIRRDGPGKCPLCGMDLVPVTTSSGGMRTISISAAARQLMRIQTAPVERRYVTAEIRMVGKVEFDETRLSHITAWIAGRLDRLYVDYTGVEVKQGDHMVYIYSEQLYSAQEELLQALKYQRDRPATTTEIIQPLDLAASAREKLRLLGLTVDQISEIEQRGTAAEHITIYAPLGGIVIDKLRQQGDRVRTGDRIYTVADLKQVWVKLDAYESDLQWLRYGQQVEFTSEAYPGETFSGRIAFIDPVLNENTRTIKVRVNVPNEDGRLKPQMFVRAVVRSHVAAGGRVLDADLAGKWISPMHPEIVKDVPGVCDICGMPLVRAETLGYVHAEPAGESKPLVIPVTSVLVTGTRAIVYVEVPAAEQPTFEGREIVLGPRAGQYYLVGNGLREGELVVTNGNFKLDSALQISAKPSMMTPAGGGGHEHGGPGTDQGGGGNETPSHGVALPPAFRSQLERVLLAFDDVTVAVEAAGLEKIRTSFAAFQEALSQVNDQTVGGQVAIMWREYSMLLSNDAVEGRDVATLQDADRVYRLLKEHVQTLRDRFGMTASAQEPAIVELDVPAEFQTQLGRLWTAYLPVQQALAADDVDTARQRVAELQTALTSIQADVLGEETAAAWKVEQANLTNIIAASAQAADVTALRSAFALLSDEMIAIVRSFGFGNVGPIYQLHCPMAFEGRGANWLQEQDQVLNPYFGATMLRCADRVDLISPREPVPSTPAPHPEHNQ